MPDNIVHNRSLYDRRTGIDRRKESCFFETERRLNMERRTDLKDRRADWSRDTQWGSIYIELLR